MLNIVSEEHLIRDCQNKLISEIKKNPDLEEIPNVIIGYPGGSTKCTVLYSKKYGFWLHSKEKENRYWNAFGVRRPESNKSVTPVVEICIPYRGINRQVQGAFARDESGNIFLVHRGNLGGGGKDAGKQLLKQHIASKFWETVKDGDKENQVIVVGAIKSQDFMSKLSDFVKEVKRIRETFDDAKSYTDLIERYVQKYKQLKETSQYEEKYKWDYIKEHENVFADLDNISEKIRDLDENFSSYFWKNGGVKHLAQKWHSQFKQYLQELFDEKKDLQTRVNDFISSIESLLKKDPEWKNKSLANPGVETAAFLLFLRNPRKYLLFTHLKPYNKYAKFFGLPDAFTDNSDKGKRYVTWMEHCNNVLIPIMDKITGTKNEMLDCQDFIYCLDKYGLYGQDEAKADEDQINRIESTIITDINQILYGPPGTGKTFKARELAVKIINEGRNDIERLKRENPGVIGQPPYETTTMNQLYKKYGTTHRIEFITFHQSYSYEDFIEGFRPQAGDNNISYKIKDGIFKRICARAIKAAAGEEDWKDAEWKDICDYEGKTLSIKQKYCEIPSDVWDKMPFVLIVDEINRGNISKIFGELLTLIEPNKRLGAKEEIKLRLPYSGEEFGVPKNLYIIGTMNSTDKSIALVDIALRRRFKFERATVEYECISNPTAKKFLLELNKRIRALKDEDHEIGHSYFMKEHIPENDDGTKLKEVFESSILPLLEEYFYNDWEALAAILGPDAIDKTEADRYETNDNGELTNSSEKQYGHRIKRDEAFDSCCRNLGLDI